MHAKRQPISFNGPYASILKRLHEGEEIDPACVIGEAGPAVTAARNAMVQETAEQTPEARERRRTSAIPERR